MDRRLIEIDLSDLSLPPDMPSLDDRAGAAAHVYERFVPYADEGWEWVTYPGSPDFDGWIYADRADHRILAGARLASRRVATEEALQGAGPCHAGSPYRTRQLTGAPRTPEPGSMR